MTALARKPDMRRFDRWVAVTNQLRTRGTEHLLAAARASGVTRFVAQSYTGWTNIRSGGPVKTEYERTRVAGIGRRGDPHRRSGRCITLVWHRRSCSSARCACHDDGPSPPTVLEDRLQPLHRAHGERAQATNARST